MAPGLLPRQVRAACRNAAGLTHQRLLPTCRRPIKRSLPSPPPAPTAACPRDSPPPSAPAAQRPSRAQRREDASPHRGRCSLRPRPGRRRGYGAQGRGQSRVARPHPSRPSRSPSRQGWVPILGPWSLGGVNAHLSLGHRCRGAGWDGWLAFVTLLFAFLKAGRRWPPLPVLPRAGAQPARVCPGCSWGWRGRGAGEDSGRSDLWARGGSRRGRPGCCVGVQEKWAETSLGWQAYWPGPLQRLQRRWKEQPCRGKDSSCWTGQGPLCGAQSSWGLGSP